MMGIWGRFFARGRTPATSASRLSVGESQPEPPVELSHGPISHGAISSDQLEESFYRFILNQPACIGDSANVAREQLVLQRMKELCDSGRFDVRSLPRMPSVLPQLMRAMKSDNLSGAQLANLIRRDPVLVGEVMRVTGSVAYRTAHPIGSLQHAVVLLGQIGLRHVVTSYVMKPILMASAGANGQAVGQRLWDHAERCAHAAVFLSKGQCDPFEAYLAGLVGFTGLGAVARLLERDLALPASSPAFIDGCARFAAQLTVQAGRHWDLPPMVLDSLVEQAETPVDAMVQPMSRVLHAAQRLAMCQLLAEQGLMDAESDYVDEAITQFPAQLLVRCRLDLRQSFAVVS